MSKVLDAFRSTKQEIPQIRFVLPGSGQEIFMRPFTTKEQKAILKAMEKEDPELIGQAFDALIQSCVLSEGFNVDDLYSKDRDAILIRLRAESVKDDFTFKWKCEDEKCKSENDYVTTIDKINFDKLKNQNMEKTIELSDRNNTFLVVGMISRGDEKDMMSYVKRNSQGIKDGFSKAEILNGALASAIKGMIVIEEIDGKEQKKSFDDLSFNDKVAIIDEITMDDRKQIQDFISSIDKFGYDLDINVRCRKCGLQQTHTMEWLSFFIM